MDLPIPREPPVTKAAAPFLRSRSLLSLVARIRLTRRFREAEGVLEHVTDVVVDGVRSRDRCPSPCAGPGARHRWWDAASRAPLPGDRTVSSTHGDAQQVRPSIMAASLLSSSCTRGRRTRSTAGIPPRSWLARPWHGSLRARPSRVSPWTPAAPRSTALAGQRRGPEVARVCTGANAEDFTVDTGAARKGVIDLPASASRAPCEKDEPGAGGVERAGGFSGRPGIRASRPPH